MRKQAIISVFIFLFTNILSMKNQDLPKKVTRRKDQQLEELIDLQKATNQLLLFQIKQDRLIGLQQTILSMEKNTDSKRLCAVKKIDTDIAKLYKKYGINFNTNK